MSIVEKAVILSCPYFYSTIDNPLMFNVTPSHQDILTLDKLLKYKNMKCMIYA